MKDLESYGLDLHCTMILEEYRDMLPALERLNDFLLKTIKKYLSESGIAVTAVEGRVKGEESLAGKLELKGSKYLSLEDLTDIVGVRVITFYSDEVDKIAAMAEQHFEIDWENSVDKRKMHDLDSFGYNSLHYICRVPEKLYSDPECPAINQMRFELQMRTTLQHMWANMHHDTGYKSGVEIPREYLRSLNRLAGMLELADDEFSRIRTEINDYRRQVHSLVSSGKFDDVPLNGDTFRSYLNLEPFDKLNKSIAAINQAEIHQVSLFQYLPVLRQLGFETLGDLDKLVKNYSDDAYKLAAHQIAVTDIDIISSAVGLQDLCIVHILENGGGVYGLQIFFDAIGGTPEGNRARAERICEQASHLPFMTKISK